MALDEAPPWWWKKTDWRSWLLFPASYVYGQLSAARMDLSAAEQIEIPVICVGNFVVGGGGKTPTVQMLTSHAKRKSLRPGILGRGHGGAITRPTVVNLNRHNAFDVGDEALLHARIATTVVAADRPQGAKLLVEHGCNIIVMDDGFQNPSLHKDYKLVVVDGRRGLGNGFTIPSGPLRVPLSRQLRHADAVLIIGEPEAADQAIRSTARAGKPVYQAAVNVIEKPRLNGKNALAFAGIADPEKFYRSLEQVGVNIVDRQGFGDHHIFTEEECGELLERAERQKLDLMTTTKDHVRLGRTTPEVKKLSELAHAVQIELVPEDPEMRDIVIATATKRALQRRTSHEHNIRKHSPGR